MRRTAGIIAVMMLLFAGTEAKAQESGLGLYNSFKGFGLSLRSACADGHTDRYQLYMDIYGIPSGRAGYPGVKFNYSRTSRLTELSAKDGTLFMFYAGPGISAGYLRDYEKGYYSESARLLQKNIGGMLALSGTFGCVVEFGKRIFLDLSLSLEGGLHLRKGEEDGAMKLSFYKNGVYQSIYPEFGIIFKFR